MVLWFYGSMVHTNTENTKREAWLPFSANSTLTLPSWITYEMNKPLNIALQKGSLHQSLRSRA